ncbi:MAG TPA: NAD(+)/NADH kinase [Terriglobales bacterium]|jgi:NAD+ kinase|nr:NAD(+)/NADH kinase [Terriglobales bacterium]
MKTAAIISKPSKRELEAIVPQVAAWLKSHGYEVVADAETAAYLPGVPVVERSQMAEKSPEFALVLGGDGTMLAAARAVAQAGIPIMGVNVGALGFLTEVPLEELYPTLEALVQNCCQVETRSMIHCHLMRGEQRMSHYDAMNDVVLGKGAIARLNEFEVRVDGEFIAAYKADGLIVSTPTGSTAYSLAAGGPILAPDVDAFIITPISSHALTHRPVVVKDTSEVRILMKSVGEEAFLTVDGQVGNPVLDGDEVTCRKSARQVRLLRLKRRTFFDVLRAKLKWGQR